MHGSFSGRTIPSDLKHVNSIISKNNQFIMISILVSLDDGTIFDAKFRCNGAPYVIGMCELLMENLIRKTYAQAGHISANYIEKLIEDKTEQTLTKSSYQALNTLVELIDDLTLQCQDIPVQDTYLETPIEESLEENCIEDFFERSHSEQLEILNTVIEKQIQPYIAIDQGSVEITKLEAGRITIKYDGSCTSCIAATGSTLDAIQKILRARVHPQLSVQVDPASLSHT